MRARDATVFIGSSSEGKRYAEYLQAALDDYCETAVWDQGAFGLSQSGLQALVLESQRVDFAVLVLTPDDITVKRGVREPSARDNVIFETGLFVGALGPQRTFIVHPRELELDLPSDLAGITTCRFRSERSDANLRAAVNPVALRIREVLEKLGTRKHHEPAEPGAPVGRAAAGWDRQTILDALARRTGAEGVVIVKRLFAWADEHPGLVENFGRGVVDGSWQAGYREQRRYLWPFALYTYGRIEIQFQHMAKRGPFADRALRNDLRSRLNQIPGVNITEDMLDRRPSIDLLALGGDALTNFTDAIEWAYRQAERGRAPRESVKGGSAEAARRPGLNESKQRSDPQGLAHEAVGGVWTPRQSLYSEFWGRMIERVAAERPAWTRRTRLTRNPQNWVDFPSPFRPAHYAMSFARGGRLRHELYIDLGTPEASSELYERFLSNRQEIERRYGRTLTWEPLPGKTACRIADYTDGSVTDIDRHDAFIAWFLDSGDRLRLALERD